MDAEVAGVWTGLSMHEGSDSIIARWTNTGGAGVCRGTTEGAPDTRSQTYVIMASMVGTLARYLDPAMGAAPVVDHWTSRFEGTHEDVAATLGLRIRRSGGGTCGGLRTQVPSARPRESRSPSSLRHLSIAAWFPLSSTSGTVCPRNSAGLV